MPALAASPHNTAMGWNMSDADPVLEPGRRMPVPTGVAMPRFETNFPPRCAPREMVDRVHDVAHWADLPSGGHFASWEEPHAVAASIRDFFRTLR